MDKSNEKKCEVCGGVKPISQFSKSYRNRCKECVAETIRQRRLKAKERKQEQDKHQERRNAQRYELTKLALQGFISHSEVEGMNTRDLAEMAVDLADETLRALSIPDVVFMDK